MRETLAEWRVVFTEEMRRGVKRRAFLLMALSVPVLTVVILGAITVIRAALDRADEGPTDIGVVDLSPDVELALGAPSGVIFYATREAGIVAFDKDETGRELFVVADGSYSSGTIASMGQGQIAVGAIFRYSSDGSDYYDCQQHAMIVFEWNCDSDVTSDAVVDAADISIILDRWGSCSDCEGDVNGDGVVDIWDLLDVLSNWGPCG